MSKPGRRRLASAEARPRASLSIRRRQLLQGAGAFAAISALPVDSGAMVAGRTRTALNSAYVGTAQSSLGQFETFLGRPISLIQLHGGRASTTDYTASIDFLLRSPQIGADTTHLPIFTLPMFCDPSVGLGTESLSACAGGLYDSYWTSIANKIATRYPTGQIICRLGEEFNGNWMPWKATALTATDYIACWSRYRNILAGVLGSRAKFDWCPACGQNGAGWDFDWSTCYPGDAVVDYVTVDFYASNGTSGDFTTYQTATNGLNKLIAFAAAHGKPWAAHEWGQNVDGAGFIQSVVAFFKAHPPAYQGWWNVRTGGVAIGLGPGTYPLAEAAYVAAFGP